MEKTSSVGESNASSYDARAPSRKYSNAGPSTEFMKTLQQTYPRTGLDSGSLRWKRQVLLVPKGNDGKSEAVEEEVKSSSPKGPGSFMGGLVAKAKDAVKTMRATSKQQAVFKGLNQFLVQHQKEMISQDQLKSLKKNTVAALIDDNKDVHTAEERALAYAVSFHRILFEKINYVNVTPVAMRS